MIERAAVVGGAGLSRWRAAGAYLGVSAIGHLIWEFAQMPFYTVWTTGRSSEVLYAAVHCAAGDVLIAASTLGLSALLLRAWPAPLARFGALAVLTTALGIGYTILSEWLNTEVWRSWAYADLMPVLPPLGTGVTPLLQWLLIPPAALLAAWHAVRSRPYDR